MDALFDSSGSFRPAEVFDFFTDKTSEVSQSIPSTEGR